MTLKNMLSKLYNYIQLKNMRNLFKFKYKYKV